MINKTAAEGFKNNTDHYLAGRAEFPHEVAGFFKNQFKITNETKILDLAAGTGKFTKLLSENTDAQIEAVEPLNSMAEVFKKELPGVKLTDGTAESIPFADKSFDLVTVSQAFHWFDAPKAIREIYRVLKPKGTLAIIWNNKDRRVPWVLKFDDILDKEMGKIPQFRTSNWKEAFLDERYFDKLQLKTFNHSPIYTLDLVKSRVLSISYVALLNNEKKQKTLNEIKTLIDKTPETKDPSFPFPHVVEVYWSQVRRSLSSKQRSI